MAKLFQASDKGVTFQVKVIPRAKRDEIAGREGNVLKVRLNAPPVEGRANEALIKFFADRLGIARGQVEIVRGKTSRHKVVQVRGVTAEPLKWLE